MAHMSDLLFLLPGLTGRGGECRGREAFVFGCCARAKGLKLSMSSERNDASQACGH
jgi:hypothetical protein